VLTTLAVLLTLRASAQVAQTETGEINGAKYKILFPDAWNKKLVVYAHGYEFTGSPSGIDNAQFGSGLTPILEAGFAVAASAYRDQGYVIPEAIEDSESLRQKFIALYGKPDSTFVVGHSMGGGISIGIVEKYGASYHGALPLCPLSSKPYVQTRKEFDLITLFNALFPGLLPPMREIMDPAIPAPPISELFKKMGAMGETLQKDTLSAVMLAARFDLRPKDLPFAVLFGHNVLKDLAVKSAGNPFDNRNTVYSGFADDWVK
jgi:pimeloyl-ACP methyl ester carboxylesterase